MTGTSSLQFDHRLPRARRHKPSATNRRSRRLDRLVTDHFTQLDQHLHAKGLPDVILARHAEMQEHYRARYADLSQHLQAVVDAPDTAALEQAVNTLKTFLEAFQQDRTPAPFDPDQLPHRAIQPNPDNRPKDTEAAFQQAGLTSNPKLQLAALGDYRLDQLSGAADPAYLAETTEIRLTPAIRAQAEALNHDPVAIYHFVRNEIEWLPSFGAIQDAELTLSAKRGNSLDIASLLIALLRASGIPARYAHGTIEVPEDRFRN